MSKMLQDLHLAIAKALARKTDSLLQEVLAGRMKMAEAQLKVEELKDRVTCEKLPSGVEVYSLDGTPFFELHTVEMKFDGTKIAASRKYRELP